MTTNNISSDLNSTLKAFWLEQFQNGLSLDKVTDSYGKIFDRINDQGIEAFSVEPFKDFSWHVANLTQAIEAKKAYYSSSLIGRISSLFQNFAQTCFGKCLGRQTPLQKAAFLLDLLQLQPNGQDLIDPQNKHVQPRMLALAKASRKAITLPLPTPTGPSQTDFVVATPKGNCYLVSKTQANRISKGIFKGTIKEVYRAFDMVNKKNVAFITSEAFIPEGIEEEQVVDYTDISKDAFPSVQAEARILKAFAGEKGIIQVHDEFVQSTLDPELKYFSFFTDLYERGPLSQLSISTLTGPQKRHLMLKLLEGVDAIHKKGYLHRDLKELNVLVQEVKSDEGLLYEPIIIDFDRCCLATDAKAQPQIASTPDYWPPEYAQVIKAAKEKSPGTDLSEIANLASVTTDKMDVWALGLMLLVLRRGKASNPEWFDMPPEAKRAHLAALKDDWFTPKAGDPIEQIIKQMLAVDPAKRISVEDALKQLRAVSSDDF